MNKKNLLIRVDASPEMGIGHFMRTLALAQAWHRAGHRATFLTIERPSVLALLWEPFGVAVMDKDHKAGSESDARITIEVAEKIGADYIVIDGYQFGSHYQKMIYIAGIKQLFIDDMGHCDRYWANKVINPNAHADTVGYRTRYRSVHGGANYAMLRQQFLPYALHRPTIPVIATNVLVTLGGGDSGLLTSRVLDALVTVNTPHGPLSITALVNPRTENLYHMTQLPGVALLSEVYDVAQVMKNAHIAIAGGGLTVWELAYMGVPSICLDRGPQERLLIDAAVERNIVEDGGSASDLYPSALAMQVKHLATNASRRKQMSNSGQATVDGDGAAVVVDIILEDINAER